MRPRRRARGRTHRGSMRPSTIRPPTTCRCDGLPPARRRAGHTCLGRVRARAEVERTRSVLVHHAKPLQRHARLPGLDGRRLALALAAGDRFQSCLPHRLAGNLHHLGRGRGRWLRRLCPQHDRQRLPCRDARRGSLDATRSALGTPVQSLFAAQDDRAVVRHQDVPRPRERQQQPQSAIAVSRLSAGLSAPLRSSLLSSTHDRAVSTPGSYEKYTENVRTGRHNCIRWSIDRGRRCSNLARRRQFRMR